MSQVIGNRVYTFSLGTTMERQTFFPIFMSRTKEQICLRRKKRNNGTFGSSLFFILQQTCSFSSSLQFCPQYILSTYAAY